MSLFKLNTQNKLLKFFMLSLTLGFFVSCNDNLDQSSKVNPDQEHLVTFSIKSSISEGPKTYNVSTPYENQISDITILLFDDKGKYVHYPIFSADLSVNPNDNSSKIFQAKIPEGNYSTILALANSNKVLVELLNSSSDGIQIGDSKIDVIKKIELLQASKWVLDSSSDEFMMMPMWGEVANFKIGAATNKNISLTVVRMLARIDVISKLAQTDLELKEVLLYNYNDRGLIAPTKANWSAEPSIPENAVKVKGPLTFTDIYKEAEHTSLIGQIYTFEAEKGSASDYLKNTSLVVGGHYKGSSDITYYRIDFTTKSSGETSYLNLLRNNRYEVDIKSVSGPGVTDPDEAFESKRVDITADILVWVDSEMSDIVDDGQNKFGVSSNQFSFTREERTSASTDNTLSVTVDYAKGWTSEIIETTGDWLKLDMKASTSTGSVDRKIILDKNTTGSARTGKIKLTSGRLSLIVTVKQRAN